MYFAAHDTTASSISYALYYLAKNYEWQQRAREEASLFLTMFDASEELTPRALKKRLPILHLIIMESWRLNPPVGGTLIRWATKRNSKLGGYDVPMGSTIFGSISTAHRSRSVWGSDADEFHPERFCQDRNLQHGPDREIENRLLTFSYGSRSCLGTAFATIQVYLGLAHIISKHQVAIPKHSVHADRCIVRPVTVVMSPVEFELDLRKVKL